jgi:hypothetical protein
MGQTQIWREWWARDCALYGYCRHLTVRFGRNDCSDREPITVCGRPG